MLRLLILIRPLKNLRMLNNLNKNPQMSFMMIPRSDYMIFLQYVAVDRRCIIIYLGNTQGVVIRCTYVPPR